jgi:hypothetical protein
MNSNWTLKTGLQSIDNTSFPYAFRTMFNMVKKSVEGGKHFSEVIKTMSILSPPSLKGERKTYSYAEACQLARNQGLLSADNQINSKEFKNK